MRPDWPGGMSGVTIGDGYDLGYSTKEDVAKDWGLYLAPNAVAALQTVVGVHGSPAHSHAQELHWITIPWVAAQAVFIGRDVPKWTAICAADLENFAELPPTCRGMVVSIAFNRGDSWKIPANEDRTGRYVEMRDIKAHMAAREFNKIPADILSMRRLWPEGSDLWRRREHEAMTFQTALTKGN